MEIVGRVTKNAAVHTVKNSERKVVNFSIAVNDRYRKKDGEVKTFTTFFNCDYWINPGIAEYLTKGSLVELSGRVSASAWLNVSGDVKASLNFHVDSIKLHGKSQRQDSAVETQPAETVPANADDLPF